MQRTARRRDDLQRCRPRGEHNGHVAFGELTIHAPSVIRLERVRPDSLRAPVTFAQEYSAPRSLDGQYCGKQYAPAELTLDHVGTSLRGGESSWDNLVASLPPVIIAKATARRKNQDEAVAPAARFFDACEPPDNALPGAADETWRKYLFYESDTAV